MNNFNEACELVKRFRKVLSQRDVQILSSVEFETHWRITYGVPSTEDAEQILQSATVIVEKQTGSLYYPPKRSPSGTRVNLTDFPKNRDLLLVATHQSLDEAEVVLAEERKQS